MVWFKLCYWAKQCPLRWMCDRLNMLFAQGLPLMLGLDSPCHGWFITFWERRKSMKKKKKWLILEICRSKTILFTCLFQEEGGVKPQFMWILQFLTEQSSCFLYPILYTFLNHYIYNHASQLGWSVNQLVCILMDVMLLLCVIFELCVTWRGYSRRRAHVRTSERWMLEILLLNFVWELLQGQSASETLTKPKYH